MKRMIFSFCLLTAPMIAAPQRLNELVYTIRNPETDANHFRQALESIGEYLAANVLEELDQETVEIRTLTGAIAKHDLVTETPVLVTILRAGLPLNSGIQKVFPNAEVGFLAMSRNEETLQPQIDYVALPDMRGKTVILSDTMLATGGSLLDAIRILEQRSPEEIFVVAAIASKAGIERISQYNPRIRIFAAAIDPILNDKGYIVPGLGDAGDRCYGKKDQS